MMRQNEIIIYWYCLSNNKVEGEKGDWVFPVAAGNINKNKMIYGERQVPIFYLTGVPWEKSGIS